ncbi:unnamed protein product, partial [Amoebophrya sp. A25]
KTKSGTGTAVAPPTIPLAISKAAPVEEALSSFFRSDHKRRKIITGWSHAFGAHVLRHAVQSFGYSA